MWRGASTNTLQVREGRHRILKRCLRRKPRLQLPQGLPLLLIIAEVYLPLILID